MKKTIYPPILGLSFAMALMPMASAEAQTVKTVGDSVSVTLAEAGTLREALIDNDVSFSEVKRIRLAGPFNSEELKFFAENTISDLVTIDMRDATPVYDEQMYASCDTGGEVGIRVQFLFSDKHTLTYRGNSSGGAIVYVRDLYDACVNDLSGVFSSYRQLKTLMLPKWMTRLGIHMASGCDNLTDVIAPSSVTEVGYCAFSQCNALKAVPGMHVKAVADGAFAYTAFNTFDWNSLERLTTDNETDKLLAQHWRGVRGAFKETALTYADLSRYDTIPAGSFCKCAKLERVDFNKSVRYIGDDAFSGTALKTVGDGSFPSLEYVGSSCFYNTPFIDNQLVSAPIAYLDKFALKAKFSEKDEYTVKDGTIGICGGFYSEPRYSNEFSVSLPSTVKYIGSEAFTRSNLTKINLPEGLERIGESAFKSTKLTSVVLPTTIKEVGYYAFDYTPVERLVIPDNQGVYQNPFNGMDKLVKVEYNYHGPSEISFSGLPDLTVVNVGANVTRLPEYFCNRCKKLSRVTIASHNDDTPFRIGRQAFGYCEQLKSITLPATTDSIGSYAFKYAALQEVNIPSSVKYIGMQAFDHCSLQALDQLPKGVVVEDEAFSGNPLKTVTIPEDPDGIHTNAFYRCNQVETATFIGMPSERKFDIQYYANTIVIGPRVGRIPEKMFASCNKVKNLVFAPRDEQSPGLSFGQDACYGIGVTRLELPEGTETIEKGAFDGCKNLRVATVPSTIKEETWLFGRLGEVVPADTKENVPVRRLNLSGAAKSDYVYKCEFDSVYMYMPYGNGAPKVHISDYKRDGATVLCVLPQYLKDYKDDIGYSSLNVVPMPAHHIPTGIGGITVRGESTGTEPADIDAIYDTTGQRLNALRPGLNIIRTKDGRVVKRMSR